MKVTELLRVAMHALRDLDAGYPASELACPPNTVVEEAAPQASAMVKLIGTIALQLAELGQLGEDDRNIIVGLLPDLALPSADIAEGHQVVLAEMIAEGLSVGDAINGFASDDDDPFVKAAREHYASGSDGDIEIDRCAVVSQSDEGAYVMGWLWVSNERAGIDEDDGPELTGVEVEQLHGAALDWATAKAAGYEPYFDDFVVYLKGQPTDDQPDMPYRPTVNWAQGGRDVMPAIDEVERQPDGSFWACNATHRALGDTQLEAALRCFVASKLGMLVSVPSELL
jgi:hypothetical protein